MTIETDALFRAVLPLAHSHLANYILPGVTSSIIASGPQGMVRMFTSSRETREFVTPHSHRFDFTCLVLDGWAENIVYQRSYACEGDRWHKSQLQRVTDGPRRYKVVALGEPAFYTEEVRRYGKGETYSMTHSAIHSIRFSRGARVLFFEGPQRQENTVILQPDDPHTQQAIPTFDVARWMFTPVSK